MDDLRSEIKSAFEQEQAGHAPAVNLRYEVVRETAHRPARTRNFQWLAVAATLAIGALVVAGLMSSRLIHRAVPAGTPEPPPLVRADYGTPPTGVPLFYVADPQHPGWYNGFDWTGKPRGTAKLAAPVGDAATVGQSPDGSELTVSGGKGGYTTFIDPVRNRVIVQDPSQGNAIQMWSDDSHQLCTLDYKTPNWQIGLASPGAASSNVHTVALDPAIVRSGVIGVTFAACSPGNDRAVLVRSVFDYPSYEWVVRLSDGSILSQRRFGANMLSSIVASSDGSLIAESSAKANGYLGPAASSTVIRRASDGSVVRAINAGYGVLAFSGDDSVALVTTTPWASGVESNVGLLEVSTASLYWQSGGEELSSFLVQPGGKAFALLSKKVGDQGPHALVSVYLVGTPHSDGYLPWQYLQP